MNSITGELYNIEGVITSIIYSFDLIYLWFNLLETQFIKGIVGDFIHIREA